MEESVFDLMLKSINDNENEKFSYHHGNYRDDGSVKLVAMHKHTIREPEQRDMIIQDDVLKAKYVGFSLCSPELVDSSRYGKCLLFPYDNPQDICNGMVAVRKMADRIPSLSAMPLQKDEYGIGKLMLRQMPFPVKYYVNEDSERLKRLQEEAEIQKRTSRNDWLPKEVREMAYFAAMDGFIGRYAEDQLCRCVPRKIITIAKRYANENLPIDEAICVAISAYRSASACVAAFREKSGHGLDGRFRQFEEWYTKTTLKLVKSHSFITDTIPEKDRPEGTAVMSLLEREIYFYSTGVNGKAPRAAEEIAKMAKFDCQSLYINTIIRQIQRLAMVDDEPKKERKECEW